MQHTQIARDPFARSTTIRAAVKTTDGCAWCGNHRKSGKLFCYGSESDGGRKHFEQKRFCSKSCRDSYYD